MEKTSGRGQGPPEIVSPLVVVVVVVAVVVAAAVAVVVIYDYDLLRDTNLWWGRLQWWIGYLTVTQINPVNSAVLQFNYFVHHSFHTF